MDKQLTLFCSEEKLPSSVCRWLNSQPLVQQGPSPYDKCGQEKFDQDDIFARLICLIPLNWWLQFGHSSRDSLQVQQTLSPFSQKVMGAVIRSLHTGHCTSSISSMMLEADIRISTFSAVPAGSVTHTNQNSFGDFLFAAHKFKMIHNLKKNLTSEAHQDYLLRVAGRWLTLSIHKIYICF